MLRLVNTFITLHNYIYLVVTTFRIYSFYSFSFKFLFVSSSAWKQIYLGKGEIYSSPLCRGRKQKAAGPLYEWDFFPSPTCIYADGTK